MEQSGEGTHRGQHGAGPVLSGREGEAVPSAGDAVTGSLLAQMRVSD